MIKSTSSEYSCYYHVIDDSMIVKAFDKLPQDSKNIRETVFVDEQGFNEEFDTVDNRAIHFVVECLPRMTPQLFFWADLRFCQNTEVGTLEVLLCAKLKILLDKTAV